MWRTFQQVVVVLALSVLPGAAHARGSGKIQAKDTVRVPYMAGKVYEIRLMPGAPFALELPAGETAKNIWVDNRWWKAKSTPGSSRVFLRALGTDDVVGRHGFIHVETNPSTIGFRSRWKVCRRRQTSAPASRSTSRAVS